MKNSIRALLIALSAALGSACATTDQPTTVRLIDGKLEETPYVSPSAYEHYLAAQLALYVKDIDRAVEHFEAAIAFDPGSPYLRTRLAEIRAAQRLDEQAYTQLNEAFRLNPVFPDALVLQGRILWRAGQPEAAGRSFERCIEHNPRSPAAYAVYAELLERQGQAARARQVLEQMVQRINEGEGHSRLALLCLRQMDYGCAARHFGLVLQSRADPETLVRLAHIHRSRGELPRAVALLREAFDRSGGDLALAAPLIEVLQQQEAKQALEDLFDILETSAGDNLQQLGSLVELCIEAGQAQRALRLVEARRNADGRSPLELERAEALARLGRADEAKALLRRLLSGEQSAVAAARLARLLQREGAYAEASQLLREALKRGFNERLVLAWSNALHLEGKSGEAVELLRQTLQNRKPTRDLLFGLGAALERAGRWRDAIAVMQQILHQDPQDAAAHNFIGFTQVEHEADLGSAERSIRQALFLQPGEGYVVDSLGWLYYKQGKLAEAERLLRMAVRLSPREAEVLGHLAEVQAALHRRSEAEGLLKRALAISEDVKLTARLRQRLSELRQPVPRDP